MMSLVFSKLQVFEVILFLRHIYITMIYAMIIIGVIYLIYKFIVFKENIIWEALKPYCEELEYSVPYIVSYVIFLQIYIFFWYKVFFYYIISIWFSFLFLITSLIISILLKREYNPSILASQNLTFSFFWSIKDLLIVILIRQPLMRAYALIGLFLKLCFCRNKNKVNTDEFSIYAFNLITIWFLATPLWAFFLVFKWVFFFKEFWQSPLWKRKTKKTMCRLFVKSFKQNYYELQYNQYSAYDSFLQNKKLCWKYSPQQGIIFF